MKTSILQYFQKDAYGPVLTSEDYSVLIRSQREASHGQESLEVHQKTQGAYLDFQMVYAS